jgi:hypothetical protein
MVVSGVPASDGRYTPARPASQVWNARLWTCCAGRAGTRIPSEALHRSLTIGRRVADRTGARPERVPTIGRFAAGVARGRAHPCHSWEDAVRLPRFI